MRRRRRREIAEESPQLLGGRSQHQHVILPLGKSRIRALGRHLRPRMLAQLVRLDQRPPTTCILDADYLDKYTKSREGRSSHQSLENPDASSSEQRVDRKLMIHLLTTNSCVAQKHGGDWIPAQPPTSRWDTPNFQQRGFGVCCCFCC